MVKHLINAAAAYLDARSKKLAVAAAALSALSPLAVLTRGYAVAQKDNRVISSIRQVKTGDKITLTVTDGNIISSVTETEGKENAGSNI